MPAKKKPAKPDPMIDDQIEDLVELWQKRNLPDGALEDDLQDACNDEAELIMENMRSESLFEQLKFLHMHGYGIEEIKELIEGWKNE